MKSVALFALIAFISLCISCNKNECYECHKNETTISTYCTSEMTSNELQSAEKTCSNISGEWIKKEF